MQTTYLGHDQALAQHFPSAYPVPDDALFAALSPYYGLYEAEQAGKYYLIFDYHPVLPAQDEERALLPLEILARTFAILEFECLEDREQEVQAVRQSLWDDGSDEDGSCVALDPKPPVRSGQNACVLGVSSRRDWG